MRRAKWTYGWLTLLLAVVFLTNCHPGTIPTITSPIAAPVQLTPFWTETPSLAPLATLSPVTFTPFPSPTPTPIIYIVQKDDLMGGIAFRHGVTVAELMTANPKVNPNLMGAGLQLIIPPSHPTPNLTQITPTAIPLQVELPVNCYPAANGGLWCLLAAHNPLEQGVKNISGQITLADASASSQTIQNVTAPMDVLPGGKSIVLSAYFSPPIPNPYLSAGALTAALLQPNPDGRFIPVTLTEPQLEIDPQGKIAQVKTTLSLPAGSQPAQSIWVLAMAYDVEGHPVGVRKLEITRPLASGESLPVELSVYSLGPLIQRVDLLAEAHP